MPSFAEQAPDFPALDIALSFCSLDHRDRKSVAKAAIDSGFRPSSFSSSTTHTENTSALRAFSVLAGGEDDEIVAALEQVEAATSEEYSKIAADGSTAKVDLNRLLIAALERQIPLRPAFANDADIFIFGENFENTLAVSLVYEVGEARPSEVRCELVVGATMATKPWRDTVSDSANFPVQNPHSMFFQYKESSQIFGTHEIGFPYASVRYYIANPERVKHTYQVALQATALVELQLTRKPIREVPQ